MVSALDNKRQTQYSPLYVQHWASLNQDTGVMACDLCVGEGEEGGVKTVYACLSERLIGRARNKH